MADPPPLPASPTPRALPPARALRSALVWLAAAAGAGALWVARDVMFLGFLGVLFGLAASAGARHLERFGVRRALGASLIVLGSVGVLVGFFAWTAPELRRQARELEQRVPEALERLDAWLGAHQSGPLGFLIGARDSASAAAPVRPAPASTPSGPAAATAPGATPPPTSATPAVGTRPTAPADGEAAAADSEAAAAAAGSQMRSRLLRQLRAGSERSPIGFVTKAGEIVGGVLLAIFLALYLAADPTPYHRGILHLVPPARRPRAEAVIEAVASVLRKWLVAQLVTMVTIGVATTALLLALHVRAAFALGVLTALTKFIPTIGAVLSGVPAIAMALLESPRTAVVVGVSFVVLQFLENHLLVPLLMQRVDLPPALTLFAQALMVVLFGPLGLLVAVPLLAAVIVIVNMLYVRDVLGDADAEGPTIVSRRHAHTHPEGAGAPGRSERT